MSLFSVVLNSLLVNNSRVAYGTMVTAIIVSTKDGTAREINNNEGGRQEEAPSSSVMAVGSVKNNHTTTATAAAASHQPSQQQPQPIKRGPGRPSKPLPPNIKKRGRGRPPKSSYSPAELAALAAKKDDAKTKTLEGKRKRVCPSKDIVNADIKQHAEVQQKMSKNLEQEVSEMLNSVPNITTLKKSNHFGQRGITQRPSGKWQVQYFWCGKSRYIGVFPSKEDAFAAYEVTRKIFEKEEPPYTDPDTDNEIFDDVAVNKRLKVVRMAVFSALSKISKK